MENKIQQKRPVTDSLGAIHVLDFLIKYYNVLSEPNKKHCEVLQKGGEAMKTVGQIAYIFAMLAGIALVVMQELASKKIEKIDTVLLLCVVIGVLLVSGRMIDDAKKLN
ncbi:MAG: hypothetical protein AAB587_00215 [Patescibacteria group bacterium]